MNRPRFNPTAIASCCSGKVRIKHDRRANTTGRTEYVFCGKEVIITDDSVFSKESGNWLGYLYIDDEGDKFILGPRYKGQINKKNQ